MSELRGYWDDPQARVPNTPWGAMSWQEFLRLLAINTVEWIAQRPFTDKMREVIQGSASLPGAASMGDMLRMRHSDYLTRGITQRELEYLDRVLESAGLRLYRTMPIELWVALMHTGVDSFGQLGRAFNEETLGKAELAEIASHLHHMGQATYEVPALRRVLRRQLEVIMALPRNER